MLGDAAPAKAKEDVRETTGLEGPGEMVCRLGEEGFRLMGVAGFCRIRLSPVSRSGARIGDLWVEYVSYQLPTCDSNAFCPVLPSSVVSHIIDVHSLALLGLRSIAPI